MLRRLMAGEFPARRRMALGSRPRTSVDGPGGTEIPLPVGRVPNAEGDLRETCPQSKGKECSDSRSGGGAVAGADRDPAGLVVIRVSLPKPEGLAHSMTPARFPRSWGLLHSLGRTCPQSGKCDVSVFGGGVRGRFTQLQRWTGRDGGRFRCVKRKGGGCGWRSSMGDLPNRRRGDSGQGRFDVAAGCLLDQATPFVGGHVHRPGPAFFLEPREVPKVGEVAALLRLHRLHPTVTASQEDARAVRLVGQCESVPLHGNPRVAGDELLFRDPEVRGHAADFLLGDADLSGPTATGGAAIALPEDGHGQVGSPGMGRAGGAFTNAASRR